MAANKKTTVAVDIKKNRIIITFVGKITKRELDSLYTDIRFCVADLKPEFDIVANYLNAEVFALNSIPSFRKISYYLISSGASHIVRILDSERLAETQVGNFDSRIQGYRPIIASSLEDAEQKLVSYTKRDGLRIYLYQAPVSYFVGDEKNDADIFNISVSGIAVKAATRLPSIGEESLFSISFPNQKDCNDIFDINSKIVRHDGTDSFAAHFLDLEDEKKTTLWKALLVEFQEEML